MQSGLFSPGCDGHGLSQFGEGKLPPPAAGYDPILDWNVKMYDKSFGEYLLSDECMSSILRGFTKAGQNWHKGSPRKIENPSLSPMGIQ